MHEGHSQRSEDEKDGGRLVLVGNPNVGKSVIFTALTGRYVTVSNYPGTTVEVAQGKARFNGHRKVVVDTPGTNNLLPMSEDEIVTRDILLEPSTVTVLQVIDSKNLKRALLLTLQLAEAKLPFVVDLNMIDEAASRGLEIDVVKLSEILGLDVVSTIATQKKGIAKLIDSLSQARVSELGVDYGDELESAIDRIAQLIPKSNVSRRSLALLFLGGDESLAGWLESNVEYRDIKRIEAISADVQQKYSRPLSYVINGLRLRRVERILAEVLKTSEAKRPPLGSVLGNLTMHPIWGVPMLLLVLYLTYKLVGEFGAGTLVDLIEGVVFGEYINPYATRIAEVLIPFSLLRDFLVGEYGLITMALAYGFAIILPIVTTFFIAFSILEDSGYLPRLAVMVDKIFRLMGLNGKAVLPMVLGLGCVTMATMTTRVLETRKERVVVTLLLALGVPCSAQLGVVLGMVGAVSIYATAVWAGVVIAVLLLVGWLASLVIPGQRSDLILELPPLRLPQFSNLLAKTLARLEWYMKEVIPLFIYATAALFVLDRVGALAFVERLAAPVVTGILNLPAKATEAFLVGFLRRDYGAAGLFALAKAGQMDNIQIVVSLVTITLFIPCVANLFMIIKERGLKTGLGMLAFIFPFALLVGGVLNFTLRYFAVTL